MKTSLLILLVLAGLIAAGPADAASVPLQNATATFSQAGFSVDTAIDGLLSTTPSVFNGWAISPEITAQTAVFETVADTGFVGGTALTFTLNHTFFIGLSASEHALGRFRLSVTTDDRATFADGLDSGGAVAATWVVLDPSSFTSANGITITKLGDLSLLVTENDTAHDVYTVVATTLLTGITGIRLEVLEDASLPFSGPGLQDTNGNFVLSEFTVDAAPVAEPTSLLLFGAMLAGMGAAARRLRA